MHALIPFVLVLLTTLTSLTTAIPAPLPQTDSATDSSDDWLFFPIEPETVYIYPTESTASFLPAFTATASGDIGYTASNAVTGSATISPTDVGIAIAIATVSATATASGN